jgi:5-methylcytosine-specific restriction endonuclease McrA
MPFHRDRYPDDWEEISTAIRERSAGQCECEGECGLHRTHPGPRRCEERNGEPAKWAKGRVVLTVAHLNHDTADNRPENLRAMCQRCHLRYDSPMHKKRAAETRRQKRIAGGQAPMPLPDVSGDKELAQ